MYFLIIIKNMKYIAIIIRIVIIIIWFRLMAISWWTPNTIWFCNGIGFVLVGLYLILQALFWPRAMVCPFIQLNCPMDKDSKNWCSK